MKFNMGLPKDPNPNHGAEKEEKKPLLSVKAVFWISILLVVLFVVMMVWMVVSYNEALAGVFVVLMFIFVVINKACWKCPSCKKHLGRFGKVRQCPHCGEEWDM